MSVVEHAASPGEVIVIVAAGEVVDDDLAGRAAGVYERAVAQIDGRVVAQVLVRLVGVEVDQVADLQIIDAEDAENKLSGAQRRIDDKETLSLITVRASEDNSEYESIVMLRATLK